MGVGRVGITRSRPLVEEQIGAIHLIRILGSGVEKGKRWLDQSGDGA